VAAPTGSGTSPIGRAVMVGAGEMATGVVVGSAEILAPASSPAAWPQQRPGLRGPESRTRQGNVSFTKCDLRHTAWAVAAAFKGRISCGCQQQGGRHD
jgi:hypothetical protein